MGGEGDVGGNRSVEWKFEVDDPKWADDRSTDLEDGRKGRRQAGADKGGQGEYFKIRIELPENNKEKKAFIEELGNALKPLQDSIETQNKLEFTLPIEDVNPDQIQISWPAKGSDGTAKKREL